MGFKALIISRLKMVANQIKGSTPTQKSALIGMAVAWAMVALWLVVALVMEIGKAKTPFERQHVLEVLFFYLGILIVISSLPLTFAAMLQSQDLPWLLSTPIKATEIAQIKVLDGLIAESRIIIPFCIPSFAAATWGMRFSFSGWIYSFFLWLFFIIFCALLSQIILLALARLLTPRRVHAVIMTANLILSVLITFVVASNPVRNPGALPLMNITTPDIIVPGKLASALLIWKSGMLVEPLLILISLIAGCYLAFLAVTALGPQIYKDTRYTDASVQGLTKGKKITTVLTHQRASISRGIALKDFRNYLRDSQLLSQIMVPLLVLVLPFVFAFQQPEFWEVVQMIAVSMVGITMYIQTSVISLSSVGLEAKTYWLIKTAPITPLRFLFAKWWFCVRFVGAITIALSLLMWFFFRLNTTTLFTMIGISVGGCMVLSGLGIGLSAIFPRFIYDNPAQRVSIWLLMWGFGLYLTYIASVGIPIGLTYFAISRDAPVMLTWLVTGSYLLMISCVFGLVPLVFGARKLASYEWEH